MEGGREGGTADSCLNCPPPSPPSLPSHVPSESGPAGGSLAQATPSSSRRHQSPIAMNLSPFRPLTAMTTGLLGQLRPPRSASASAAAAAAAAAGNPTIGQQSTCAMATAKSPVATRATFYLPQSFATQNSGTPGQDFQWFQVPGHDFQELAPPQAPPQTPPHFTFPFRATNTRNPWGCVMSSAIIIDDKLAAPAQCCTESSSACN
eukprot:1385754-Rhodomonas_salina.1